MKIWKSENLKIWKSENLKIWNRKSKTESGKWKSKNRKWFPSSPKIFQIFSTRKYFFFKTWFKWFKGNTLQNHFFTWNTHLKTLKRSKPAVSSLQPLAGSAGLEVFLQKRCALTIPVLCSSRNSIRPVFDELWSIYDSENLRIWESENLKIWKSENLKIRNLKIRKYIDIVYMDVTSWIIIIPMFS